MTHALEWNEYFDKAVIGLREVRGNSHGKAIIDAEGREDQIREAHETGENPLQIGAKIGYELDDAETASTVGLLLNHS